MSANRPSIGWSISSYFRFHPDVPGGAVVGGAEGIDKWGVGTVGRGGTGAVAVIVDCCKLPGKGLETISGSSFQEKGHKP